MTREQFVHFCERTVAASTGCYREDLSHSARCCLTRYHQVHGSTWDELGLLFLVTPNTARKAYDDVSMYVLMMDPLSCAPTMMNRPLNPQEVVILDP